MTDQPVRRPIRLPPMWDVQAPTMVPGKVYKSNKTKEYVYVLGTLPGKPGWAKVRRATEGEIRAYEQARKANLRKPRPRPPAGPINTVVDLRGVEPYPDWYDDAPF